MFKISHIKYVACALVAIIFFSWAMDKPLGVWPIAKDVANLSYQACAKLGLIETGPKKELNALLSEYLGNCLNKRSNERTINEIISLIEINPQLMQEDIQYRMSLLTKLTHISNSLGPLYEPLAERLFESGIPLHVDFNCGETALIMASHYGNIRMMQRLLDKGARIDLSDNDGTTALMSAAQNGRMDAVRLLVNGVPIKKQEPTSYLRLLPAELIKTTQEYLRANPNIKDKQGNTALALAIKAVEALLADTSIYNANRTLSDYEEIIDILEPITAREQSVQP